MNIKLIITLSIAIVIATLSFFTFSLKNQLETAKKENVAMRVEIKKLNLSYEELAKSFFNLSKQRTYSISLAPNINSKISSTFGSSKNLTFQYYFTMDGNKLEIMPDSTFILKK